MEALCKSHDLVPQVLVRSVSTRWNSVSEMIDRAVKLQPVVSELCKMPEFNKRTGVRLRRFILSDEEWSLLESLQPLLSVRSPIVFVFQILTSFFQLFLFATKAISKSATPCVHQVIPYIDQITKALDDFSADLELPPAVRAAALRGKTVLNKYYSKTDESIINRIAMSSFWLLFPDKAVYPFQQLCIPRTKLLTSVNSFGNQNG